MQTDVIYLDMSKAFDKVNHSLLLNKLQRYNIRGNLLSWFTSYLASESQTTSVSTWSIPVLMYVNALSGAVKTSIRLHALLMIPKYSSGSTPSQSADAASLQSDINNLDSWASDSGLKFNQLKSISQRTTRKKHPVEFSYTMNGKLLTGTRQEKDRDTDRVLSLSKANKLLGFLKRSAKEEIQNPTTRGSCCKTTPWLRYTGLGSSID